MTKKRLDLSGTAKCMDCGALAEYAPSKEAKFRSLIIRHAPDCPNGRD